MVAAIRQTVTVTDDGTLEIRSPDLRAGDRAEVIILVDSQATAAPDTPGPTPLEALRALQGSLSLTPQAAQTWIDEMRAERESWGTRR